MTKHKAVLSSFFWSAAFAAQREWFMFTGLRKKFIGDRLFYRRYITLAVPMIIQNAITNFVSFLDNIMVGQLGGEAISAVATVNQLVFVLNLAIFGAVSAGSIFGAQYYGKGDHEGHMYSFRFKLYSSVLVTLIGIGFFLLKGRELILLFLTETGGGLSKEIAISYGLKYMGIILIGLIPFAVNQAYSGNIKETGQTVIPMLAGMMAVVINAIFDYLLIFGIGFFPALGVEGAAIATVAARYIEAAVVIIWAHRHRASNRYLEKAYRGFGIPLDLTGRILKKGMPLMINEFLWAVGVSTVTQCYSVRGMEVLTAQSISSTVGNLFNIVFIQLGVCISIMVGQLLGAGELEKAKDTDNKMMAFSLFCCVITAALMVLLGRLFPALYKVDDSIRALAGKFIMVAAFWMPSACFCHCAYFTLRSGGKTLVTFLFDSVFSWVIVVPLAFILTHYSGFGIVTVFFLVQGTEFIKAVIGFLMVKSNVWLVQMV